MRVCSMDKWIGVALLVVAIILIIEWSPPNNASFCARAECGVGLYCSEKKQACVLITNYEECVDAGYPVLESYPEQCKTPDGKTFVRVLSEACQSDAVCESGYFCRYGLCTEFSPETSCDTDNDCVLIDTTKQFSCCYAGYCDEIDYSISKWEAVNAQWFSNGQTAYCPSAQECGPAPGCPTRIVNNNYRAACQNRLCVKEYVSPN